MNADLKLVATGDGSVTLYSDKFRQHYHSIFGAFTESKHIFIEAGLHAFMDRRQSGPDDPIVSLLEVGLGTGLNCLLTCAESHRLKTAIAYTAIEPFPIGKPFWSVIGFDAIPGLEDYASVFTAIHQAPYDSIEVISEFLWLQKQNSLLESARIPENSYHIIYFDAFSPDIQPGLWTEEIFIKLFRSLKPGGVLVTYCVKGTVVRATKSAGFNVEKLPGPPGKRHILRCIK